MAFTMTVTTAWTVTGIGAGPSPLIIHVPHSGTWIPDDVRSQLLLDDSELGDEMAKMTDWQTDRMALDALAMTDTPATVFTNRASRLVVDPERFVGDAESMSAVGMGPVYHSTSALGPLRRLDPEHDVRMLDRWFFPYAEAFAKEVDQLLARHGSAVIVDLHSFPKLPLPYEADPTARRPGICLGSDLEHTPDDLRDLALGSFAGVPGGTALDTPFAGTYVPLKHLGRDRRVRSIMIEVRRDLYQTEPAGPLHDGYNDIVTLLGDFLLATVTLGA